MCANFMEKEPMSTTSIVIISVIILHFLVGIGYLMYKLNGKNRKIAFCFVN